jgi:hypothetical protein
VPCSNPMRIADQISCTHGNQGLTCLKWLAFAKVVQHCLNAKQASEQSSRPVKSRATNLKSYNEPKYSYSVRHGFTTSHSRRHPWLLLAEHMSQRDCFASKFSHLSLKEYRAHLQTVGNLCTSLADSKSPSSSAESLGTTAAHYRHILKFRSISCCSIWT